MEVEKIISKYGDQPIFNLTLNEFMAVTKAVIQGDNKPNEVKKYFDRKYIMDTFGISYPSVIDHEKRGLLKSSARVGHKFFYTQEDIDAYLTRLPKAPSCPVR